MNPVMKDGSSMTRILEAIGKRLTELRIRKGYTSHVAFAEDFNLPRVQYWRMEKGRANFTIKSLNRVLAIHGLTIQQLFAQLGSNGHKGVEQQTEVANRKAGT
jgi:transcriptional regulator with XRE-family HTH domain